ncbi:serine hydrolase domain-containing protein [Glycomyces salinus]|uniref:serine hydrolase domain-containing protein n=1 Tax=Glycomyces salinus TaxID=980294 RepID=UPI0018ED5E0C|nr:serine hydrolase domain-containing protein [Glycomyces salinus]
MQNTLIIAVAAALTGAPAPPAQVDTAHADIDSFIEQRLDDLQVPGAAWAVVSSAGIEHQSARGEDGDGGPVTATTPFLWGSVAKPVTATAVMTLVEDGAIDLDEPAATYLPDFHLADRDHSDRITVRHLLEQTSGIPADTGITDRADPYGEAVADLADAEPVTEPGAEHLYASANYLVLGAIVEAVTGETYADYLQRAVLDPLGMDGAITTTERSERVAEGHSYFFGRPVGMGLRFDPTGPSYGYLGGTIEDLAAFAAANLSGGGGVLEPETVERMHTGTATMSGSTSYGLGWKDSGLNDDLGTRTIWHSGGTPGFSAVLVLLPELDRAVVLHQNLYHYFADTPLIFTALDAARLLAGGDVSDREVGPLYPTLLASLSALLLAAIAIGAWNVRRIRRPSASAHRGRTIAATAAWGAGGLAVAYAAAIGLPSAAGGDLHLLRLIVPDLAALLTALAAATIAAAALRVWAGTLRLRRTGD